MCLMLWLVLASWKGSISFSIWHVASNDIADTLSQFQEERFHILSPNTNQHPDFFSEELWTRSNEWFCKEHCGSYTPSTQWSYMNTSAFPTSACLHYAFPVTKGRILCCVAHLMECGLTSRTTGIHLASISFYSKALGLSDPWNLFIAWRDIESWRKASPGLGLPKVHPWTSGSPSSSSFSSALSISCLIYVDQTSR